MKIAFVYDAVYPWEKGGAQKRIWELARRLTESHDVHLYGMHYWDGPAVVEREGVTLHGVCEPKELYTEGRRSISQAVYFSAMVTPALLREEFDIIDCQEFPYFPCFVGKAHELLRQSNLVITWYEVWDDYWYEYLGKKGIFGKIIERASIRLVDIIIPISDYIKKDLQQLGRIRGVRVVENGVDFEELQSVPEADTEWDIVYVGRLSEHKNVDLLLESVQVLSERFDCNVSCGIIGDGPEREPLEQHAIDIGVNQQVEFLGFVEKDEDVIGNIKSASVFVLPSIREGFPNTILEANACGVPSIVIEHAENGSTAVVENGKTGYVTELDAVAVAKRVKAILTDEELYKQFSDNARTFAQEHDWDNIVSDLEQVYLRALSEDKEV